MSEALRKHVDRRLKALHEERQSWHTHWRELAEYILPRRYKWLATANAYKGSPINGKIIDSTGTVAARRLAAGMMSGITSPTRPWFKLGLVGIDQAVDPVNVWLSECTVRLQRIFQGSNFYDSIGALYLDLAVFGTAPILLTEDFDDVIRCYNPAAGEYFLDVNDRLAVDTFGRQFPLNVKQIVEWFGRGKVSPDIGAQWDQGHYEAEYVIGHLIEPNADKISGVPKNLKFREVYWEIGRAKDRVLSARGYNEFPVIAPRWDVTANEPYGRGPGMDALGDIKQLQLETKRKLQAIDKMVNPPMLADIQLKNQPASILPGGVTYVAGINNGVGFKPVYEVMPPVRELMEDINEVRDRIMQIFFNDLFMMFQQMQAEPRSAAAIDARREEKLVMLGPVLERFEREALDPIVKRSFQIAFRAGLMPPPPAGITPGEIDIEYVSMLAEAQRAVATSSIERVLATTGNLVAVVPEIMDILDTDEAITDYALKLGVEPKLLRDSKAVAALRQGRIAAAQQQQAAAALETAAPAAKVLSETDVGGGQSMLQSMLGVGGPLQ